MTSNMFKFLATATAITTLVLGTQAIAPSNASASEGTALTLTKQEKRLKRVQKLEQRALRVGQRVQRLEEKAQFLEQKNNNKKASRLERKASRLERKANRLERKANRLERKADTEHTSKVSVPEPGTVGGLCVLGLAGVLKKLKS